MLGGIRLKGLCKTKEGSGQPRCAMVYLFDLKHDVFIRTPPRGKTMRGLLLFNFHRAEKQGKGEGGSKEKKKKRLIQKIKFCTSRWRMGEGALVKISINKALQTFML